MSGYIYLASPYSHVEAKVREQRYYAALDFVARHFQWKRPIFSPIVYCHEMAVRFELGTDAANWQFLNKAMLAGSAGLVVLMLEGWQDSAGVLAEIEQASKLNLPIRFER